MRWSSDRPTWIPNTRAILVAIGIATLAMGCAGDRRGPEVPLAEVVRVIDGDTVVVRSGSSEESVRVIGIDTPEVAHHGQPGECGGVEAAARTMELLPKGVVVTLYRDTEARDSFGRLLAYIAVGEHNLSLVLIEEGHARPLSISPNLLLADTIATLSERAAQAGVGIWGSCPDPDADD